MCCPASRTNFHNQKSYTMNKELTIKLLSLYRELDNRETLKHFMPVRWNGKNWCGATEGHHFILIPENEENKVEQPPCTTVDIARIIPEFDCIITVPITELKSTYDSIPLVDEEITEECDCCEGVGRFEHYGHDYDCQSCDETGEIGTGRFEKVKDTTTDIKIGVSRFKPRFIKTLIEVVEYTNCQRLEIRRQKHNSLTIFELGNQILVGIMCLMDNDEHETKERKVVTVNVATETV